MEKSKYLMNLCKNCKIPPYCGIELLDPSIIYAIQLTNAAADQIFKMLRILEILDSNKICGHSEHITDLGTKVTSVLDELIDFAAEYAKSSV